MFGDSVYKSSRYRLSDAGCRAIRCSRIALRIYAKQLFLFGHGFYMGLTYLSII